MAYPDATAVDVLAAAGIGLTEGSNLFAGPVRPPIEGGRGSVPSECVFCLATGGPEPFRFIASTNNAMILHSVVQVTIRSDRNNFESGQTLARNVWDSLETDDWSGYIEAKARESEPLYIGIDDIEHHRWVVNVETWREV